ncbi:hypothetical protein B0H19DRAFT_1069712 [Mycena capillaripes]|nr:hypothetical protein B0H19DRAFT_1069712 [Mycena capillaripes]
MVSQQPLRAREARAERDTIKAAWVKQPEADKLHLSSRDLGRIIICCDLKPKKLGPKLRAAHFERKGNTYIPALNLYRLFYITTASRRQRGRSIWARDDEVLRHPGIDEPVRGPSGLEPADDVLVVRATKIQKPRMLGRGFMPSAMMVRHSLWERVCITKMWETFYALLWFTMPDADAKALQGLASLVLPLRGTSQPVIALARDLTACYCLSKVLLSLLLTL